MSVAKIETWGGPWKSIHMLAHQDRQRKDLFAGRAARDPDPHAVAGVLALEQARDDLFLEYLERVGIPEKARDVDQQVAKQGRYLARVALEPLDVVIDRVDTQHVHPAVDPAQKGILLVAAEIVAEPIEQDGADLPARGGDGLGFVAFLVDGKPRRGEIARQLDQPRR